MSAENDSIIARILARFVDRIGSTRFSDEDRSLVRQHMLDAIAAAFIGCRGKAFNDLARLCQKIDRKSVV